MPVFFSEHSKKQLKRRKIKQKDVLSAVESPDEIGSSFKNRKLRRKRINGKILEVVTRTEGSRITVITGYFIKD